MRYTGPLGLNTSFTHITIFLVHLFVLLVGWLFYNAVPTPGTWIKLDNHEDAGKENVTCARFDGSISDLLRFLVLWDVTMYHLVAVSQHMKGLWEW